MQKSFQKAIGIACFVALMQCLVLIMTCCHSGFNANKNTIHYSDVEKIHIGMLLDSVVLVLGMPYTFSSNLGDHDLSCKCPRDVSDIKMTTKTDFVHFIDSVFQDMNYCCEQNRKNMKVIEKHATLNYTEEPSFLKSILILRCLLTLCCGFIWTAITECVKFMRNTTEREGMRSAYIRYLIILIWIVRMTT